MSGYLTLAETARALRVSATTVRDLLHVKQGRGRTGLGLTAAKAVGRIVVRPDGWTLAGLGRVQG